MSFTEKIRDFIAPAEEENELELTEEEATVLSTYEKPKDATVSKINSSANIVLFEPRNFDEAEEIGRHIKNHRACCINLHKMPLEYRQRMIDFFSGVV